MCAHACMCTCVCVCCVQMHNVCVCMCVCMYVHVGLCTYVRAYKCECLHAYIRTVSTCVCTNIKYVKTLICTYSHMKIQCTLFSWLLRTPVEEESLCCVAEDDLFEENCHSLSESSKFKKS